MDERRARLWRRMHALAHDCEVTHAELRDDLAPMALHRDVRSLTECSDADLGRLIDHLHGWVLVDRMRSQKPTRTA